MNLLVDRWLPVVRRDGTREKVAICDLLDEHPTNPIVDVEAPRADFRNAIYQLLIGIVQVAAAPEDEEDWYDLWKEPYTSESFREKVLIYEDCFEIDSDGPAFMQDFDSDQLLSKEHVNVFRLLLGTPGENTVKLNRDLFVKELPTFQLDAYWAAIALFLSQQVAGPPDGGGHREGLRGSGALTTLVLPIQESSDTSLWQVVWTNIFPQEETMSWNGNSEKAIFPWMTSTISSTGNKVAGFDVFHPLCVYWGMPWRVRFVLPALQGVCQTTGSESRQVIRQHCRLKHGNMYSNLWRHPFTPYKDKITDEDLEKNKKPSMRADSDRFLYTNWAALCLGNDKFQISRILSYHEGKRRYLRSVENLSFRLWASGFHMVPGEATVKNWNEAFFPLLYIAPEDSEYVEQRVEVFITQASNLAFALLSAVQEAWFTRPKDIKKPKDKLSFLTTSFWQNTEPDFYELLDRMVKNLDSPEVLADCAKQWRKCITREAYDLFDKSALTQQEDGLDMRRVVAARGSLEKQVGKAYRELNNLIEIE